MEYKEISVLCVEDDEEHYENIRDFLAKDNIIVTAWVTNSYDAIKIIKEQKFDIITVDLGLGEEQYGGLEIVKQAKIISAARIIVISGYDLDSRLTNRCLKAGADAYKTKFELEELAQTICKLLEGDYVYAYMAEALREELLTEAQKNVYEDLIENEEIDVKDIAKKHNISYKHAWNLKHQVINIMGDIKRLFRKRYNKNGRN